MSYKFAQLNIRDHQHGRKTGEVLIQPGDSIHESDLYLMIEIDSKTPEDQQFIKQFLEIAFFAYEKNKLFEPEKSLEKILYELNLGLPPLFAKKRAFLSLIHCFVGLYHDGFLTFSLLGKINVYLIKSAGIQKINGKNSDEDNNKIFNYILSGNIKDNDKILITNESLTDYIALEKIKKTIAALPPSSSIAHFNNILQATPPHVSFLSIIIGAPQTKENAETSPSSMPTKLNALQNSKSSLDQLLSVQKETEKILKNPSLMQTLQDKWHNKDKARTAESKNISSSKPKINFKLNKLIINIFKSLNHLGKFIFLTEKRKQITLIWRQKFSLFIKRFGKMPKMNKTFFLIAVFLLLLLTQNLITQSKKKDELATEAKFNEIVQQIEGKQSGIEASLIYNDTNRAKILLEEINQLLNDLPLNTKSRLAKKEDLAKNVNAIFNRIWKVIDIAEPTILYDFKQLSPEAQIFSITIKNDLLYAPNSTNQLFIYNLNGNQAKILDRYNYPLKLVKNGPNNTLIGQSADKKFFLINNEEIAEINVNGFETATQIDDLAFYLDKMYVLDRQAKQINRFTYYSGSNEFLAKQSWIKEDLPVNRMVALTIDGYVYALMDNGEIFKLAAGKKQSVLTTDVEPKISAPTKIYTDGESNLIYILDPANKRFLIIDKNNGELKNQYISEKFNQLKDFIIKEKEHKIYLLNGSQVVVIGI